MESKKICKGLPRDSDTGPNDTDASSSFAVHNSTENANHAAIAVPINAGNPRPDDQPPPRQKFAPFPSTPVTWQVLNFRGEVIGLGLRPPHRSISASSTLHINTVLGKSLGLPVEKAVFGSPDV